jgi:predicted transcriptional regulator
MREMMEMDKLLELLRDSEWHSIAEIKPELLPLQETAVKKIIRFLAQYGFISHDKEKDRAKINPLGLSFLELPVE